MIDNFIGKNCFRCLSKDLVLDYKAGDIICRECGEIVSDRFIDEGNEALNYSLNDEKSQTSRSSGMNDGVCMQTMFVNGPEHIRKALEKAQQMSSDKKEMFVLGNLSTVNEMCSKLNLSRTIQDCAVDIFSRSISEGVILSRSKEPIIASCLYLACRLSGYPRTIEEVARHTGTDSVSISKMQGVIARGLALQVGVAQVTPESLVNRLSAQLGLSHSVSSYAREMCAAITRYELYNYPAQVVAGAALLWVCALSRITLDISLLSSTALVTSTLLKTVFAKMHSSLVVVVPAALLQSYGESWRKLPEQYDKVVVYIEREMMKAQQLKETAAKQQQQQHILTHSINSVKSSSLAATVDSSPASSSQSSESCVSTATSTESIASNNSMTRNGSNTSLASTSSVTTSTMRRAKSRLSNSESSSDFIKEHGSIFIPRKKARTTTPTSFC